MYSFHKSFLTFYRKWGEQNCPRQNFTWQDLSKGKPEELKTITLPRGFVFLSNTTGSNSFSEQISNIWHSLNPLILCVPSVAQPLNLVLLIFSDSTSLTPSSQTRRSKPAQQYCFKMRAATLRLDSMISLDKFRKPILEKWLSVTWFRSGHILANIYDHRDSSLAFQPKSSYLGQGTYRKRSKGTWKPAI